MKHILQMDINILSDIAKSGIVGCSTHKEASFTIMELANSLSNIYESENTKVAIDFKKIVEKLDEWNSDKKGSADGTHISALKIYERCIHLLQSLSENFFSD